MEVVMKISKWGNSLAVRLPSAVTDRLNLKEGDEIDVSIDESGRAELVRRLTKEDQIAEAMERLKKFRGRIPADFKFDREEAHARK